MAAVDITISGILYDKLNRTTQNVVLIGEATLTGLGVGGGPIYPPGGDKPPHIWGGGNEPFPTPPIVIPPNPPTDGEAVKPPPADGGWGYFPEYGWGYFPKAGEAGPKK